MLPGLIVPMEEKLGSSDTGTESEDSENKDYKSQGSDSAHSIPASDDEIAPAAVPPLQGQISKANATYLSVFQNPMNYYSLFCSIVMISN